MKCQCTVAAERVTSSNDGLMTDDGARLAFVVENADVDGFSKVVLYVPGGAAYTLDAEHLIAALQSAATAARMDR